MSGGTQLYYLNINLTVLEKYCNASTQIYWPTNKKEQAKQMSATQSAFLKRKPILSIKKLQANFSLSLAC